uniref:Uncharacterized protein n=1 Tax=Chromera velia CCMP2878 TaxID=1169474 RepID=A0A0G4FZM3_9ALVE|eukprot:Cvel_3953.t1-p1 / transcript=Cvel_3953.t1 / gene=Cvel_3953 / organism=Chromera_velia_CCMP2878 / gene_product=hypothetical protein / transcript_product=hypothetical protein / location=Cvel_scaffold168:12113-21589(-) / protein_length=76 / sequence_SO=supercontig / SO=protein_coding / is_pseudo=false
MAVSTRETSRLEQILRLPPLSPSVLRISQIIPDMVIGSLLSSEEVGRYQCLAEGVRLLIQKQREVLEKVQTLGQIT